MNIHTLKGLTWLAAFAVGGTLGWEVTDFLRNKPLLEVFVSQEEQLKVLRGFETPAEPRRNLVDYGHVRNTFLDMPWTGEPAPEVVVGPPPEGPLEKPKTPIASLLEVLYVQVHTTDPAESLAFVKYTDVKLTAFNRRSRDRILRVGDRLFAPYDHVQVDALTPEGVRFVFDDEERAPEVVAEEPYPSDRGRLVFVDHAVLPSGTSRIWNNPNPPSYRPGQTVRTGRNEFLIGTETAAEVDRDYALILSRDLQYRTARDPRTGSVVGIQITKVAPGSIPAQHGVTSGEIVKSINGHPVTSVNDAVAYVKGEAGTTNTWIVVFEKQGKEFTRIYKSPEE